MNKVAWKVEDEESAWIVMAPSAKSAKAKGAYMFLSEAEYVTAERSPEYDEYAELGYVPPKELINRGWYLECQECSSRIDSDNEQEDEQGNYYYPEPVFEGEYAYCCQDCYDIWIQKKKTYKKRKAETISLLTQRYPFARGINVYGGWTESEEVYAFFTYGNNRRAEWRSSDPDHVSIRGCDKEEWLCLVNNPPQSE